MSPCFPLVRRIRKINKEIYLAILGLDNAGKTTTTRSIKGIPSELVAPTIGFDRIEFISDRYSVNIYDLGGRRSIRAIWKNYFAELHGVIFVVDSVAKARFDECRCALASVLAHPCIAGKPILILANKQDVSSAISDSELAKNLELRQLAAEYKCPCQLETCCALLHPKKKLDKGIRSGLQWLLNSIESQLPQLDERIKLDTIRQQELQALEREIRRERVRLIREKRKHRLAHDNDRTGSSGDSVTEATGMGVEYRDQELCNTVKRPVRSTERRSPSSDTNRKPRNGSAASLDRESKLSRRSLPASAIVTPEPISSRAKERKKHARASTRSVDSRLPPVPNYRTRHTDLKHTIDVDFKVTHEPCVPSDHHNAAEVMEIEELDEVEPSPIDHEKQVIPAPRIEPYNVEPKNNQSVRLPIRPRTRRIAPYQGGFISETQLGNTPDIVGPLYGHTAATPVETIPVPNDLADGQQQATHLALSSTIKRPSPRARIFTPNINKLHPMRQNSDSEQ